MKSTQSNELAGQLASHIDDDVVWCCHSLGDYSDGATTGGLLVTERPCVYMCVGHLSGFENGSVSVRVCMRASC